MYIVLVTGQAESAHVRSASISHARYLEYTSETISKQLQSLSHEAVECFKSWPCLLMQEGRSDERAHVVRVTAVDDKSGGEIQFQLEPVPVEPPLINDAIWKLRDELGIEQFEFARNHLAVKDRNLAVVLTQAGYRPDLTKLFDSIKPLPSPSRARLIKAIDAIEQWSHTDIDRFLLEAGVSSLKASRELGGRRERALAIVKFAIDNPSSITAEERLFSVVVVSRAEGSKSLNVISAGSVETDAKIQIVEPQPTTSPHDRSPNRVFVVHGRNEAARASIVAFLSSQGLEAIVLHEQPNMGRHLLTKFVDEAELVTFAVVLMTGDDMGGTSENTLKPRARQNVILELGYFLSHLGQARVCAIVSPGLETPSDFDGIVYIEMNDSLAWQRELLRELEAAHMPILRPNPD